MSAPIYGREALRQYRERQAQGSREHQASLLDQISPDVPMEDAAITVWDGQRFVAYEKWLATAPLIVEEREQRKLGKDRGTNAAKAANVSPQKQSGELW